MVRLAKTLLRSLHIGFLLFTLVGWLLPPRFLWIYLVWIPLMVLQWQLNQGTCVLTNLEYALVDRLSQESGVEVPKKQQQGKFIKSIMRSLFGQVPSDQILKYLINGLVWGCWGLGWFRFYIGQGGWG